MKMFSHEIAISAVPFDSLSVSGLSTRLSPRIGAIPHWGGGKIDETPESSTDESLAATTSRLAVVLHQRLWGHDTATGADAEALRKRMDKRAKSVAVVLLDAGPLPHWLGNAAHCSLSDIGLDGATEFVLEGFSAAGGTVRPPRPAVVAPPENPFVNEVAFVSKPRALTTLRHELVTISEHLEECVKAERATRGDRAAHAYCAPDRLVGQFGDVGLSFSWLASRSGAVAEGRLLVVEWSGTVAHTPRRVQGQTAVPVRERLYRPEAVDAASWQWRAQDPEGAAYSSANLADQWLASAMISAYGGPAVRTA
jgi:hypothetical protein